MTELPDELFQLTYLTGLNLGSRYAEGGIWKPAEHIADVLKPKSIHDLAEAVFDES